MSFETSPLVPGSESVDEQVWQGLASRVCNAVFEALGQLPSTEPTTIGDPVRQADLAALPDPAGAAVTAFLNGGGDGKILLVVSQELVAAMEGTPFGDVPLVQALRPMLDAVAENLDARLDGDPTDIEVESCLEVLTGGTPVLVPVMSGTKVAALLAVSLLVVSDAPGGGAGAGSAAAGGGSAAAGSAAGSAGSPTAGDAARSWGIDMLRDVEMEVTCELGRTRMTVRQLLALAPGDVVELDRLAGSPADLLVNGTLLARGEVVVVDESFGLRITEIVTKDAS